MKLNELSLEQQLNQKVKYVNGEAIYKVTRVFEGKSKGIVKITLINSGKSYLVDASHMIVVPRKPKVEERPIYKWAYHEERVGVLYFVGLHGKKKVTVFRDPVDPKNEMFAYLFAVYYMLEPGSKGKLKKKIYDEAHSIPYDSDKNMQERVFGMLLEKFHSYVNNCNKMIPGQKYLLDIFNNINGRL